MSQILGLSRVGRLATSRTDWHTPPFVATPLVAEFDLRLDVCASPETAVCESYFTKRDDALTRDWAPRRCWMNPPYGREIGQWIRKAYEESLRGALVVCLVPARTDTAWWHDYCAKAEVRFIRGRIRFEGARWNAPFPSAVVIFEPGMRGSTS